MCCQAFSHEFEVRRRRDSVSRARISSSEFIDAVWRLECTFFDVGKKLVSGSPTSRPSFSKCVRPFGNRKFDDVWTFVFVCPDLDFWSLRRGLEVEGLVTFIDEDKMFSMTSTPGWSRSIKGDSPRSAELDSSRLSRLSSWSGRWASARTRVSR